MSVSSNIKASCANIPYAHNPNWPIAHGFFGIAGGISTGLCAGLNGGWDRDTKENVETNRSLALYTLGINAPGFIGRQKHTTNVLTIPRDVSMIESPADALVTQSPHVALGVITADCAPVLFYDPCEKIIASAHAGWRGAVNGILENTVQAMCDLGAKPSNIQATIGPTIARSSYSVSTDFLDGVQEKTLFSIKPMTTFFDNRWFFDLPMYIYKRLDPLVSNIYNLGLDTFGETFFSRRYALTAHQKQQTLADAHAYGPSVAPDELWDCGRNMSWISLTG